MNKIESRHTIDKISIARFVLREVNKIDKLKSEYFMVFKENKCVTKSPNTKKKKKDIQSQIACESFQIFEVEAI